MSGAGELQRIASRLRELSERLSADDLGDEEAESLAREAADLATEGGSVLEAQLRELSAGDQADGGL